VGGSFDHREVNGNCASCHDGSTADGMSLTHFVTTQECNVCHSTQGWSPIYFTHPSNSDYPGDHNSSVTCKKCHDDNSETIAYSSPGYAPYCAACHESDYDSGEHRGTLSDNKNCAGSRCHRTSDRNWD
jgi:hypothetical protein